MITVATLGENLIRQYPSLKAQAKKRKRLGNGRSRKTIPKGR